MDSSDIKEIVKEKYGQAAARVKSGGGCCCSASSAFGEEDPITKGLYAALWWIPSCRDLPLTWSGWLGKACPWSDSTWRSMLEEDLRSPCTEFGIRMLRLSSIGWPDPIRFSMARES